MSSKRPNKARYDPSAYASKLSRTIGWNYDLRTPPQTQAFCAAYLDPCHQGHITNCEGIPIIGSQPHSKFAHTYDTDITVPAGQSVIVYLTPFIECPLIVYNTFTGHAQGYPDPAFTSLKELKAYGIRPFGLGCTVSNPNPDLTKQGMIAAARLPPCIDKHAITIPGGTSYVRVLEGLPDSYTSVSSYPIRYSGEAKKGVYLPNRVVDGTFPFVYRSTEWDKAEYTPYLYNEGHISPGNPIKNPLAITVTRNGMTEMVFVSKDENVATIDSANNIPVTGAAGLGMMVGCIAFSSMQSAQIYNIKVAHGYELLLKAKALLNVQYYGALSPDPAVVQALFRYLSNSALAAAYPANFNFWGKLWNGFKSVYRKLRPLVPKLISVLPGAAGPVANLATDVVDQLVS